MTIKPLLVLAVVAVLGGSNVAMNAAENTTEQRRALDILATAKTFDDGVAGERPGNGQSPLYATYHKLMVAEKPVPTATLMSMQKSSTAAGRLYIAALTRELDSGAGIGALRQLFSDKTKVTYVSGCESTDYSVGEIAKQLLDSGKFQNFRLRARCKT